MLLAEFIVTSPDLPNLQNSQTLQNFQIIQNHQKTSIIKNPQKFKIIHTSKTLQDLENSDLTLTGTEHKSEEYKKFLSADPGLKKPPVNVLEVQGNFFDTDSNSTLAHCVSADFKMSKGLALIFRRKFGQITQLRKQKKAITEIASVETDGRTIFYLVTKEHYWQKPTYQNLFQTFQNLKKLCT